MLANQLQHLTALILRHRAVTVMALLLLSGAAAYTARGIRADPRPGQPAAAGQGGLA